MFSNPVAKVKADAFAMRGDFNLARASSVAENTDVLVEFLFDVKGGEGGCSKTNRGDCYLAGEHDGYIICFKDVNDYTCQICSMKNCRFSFKN